MGLAGRFFPPSQAGALRNQRGNPLGQREGCLEDPLTRPAGLGTGTSPVSRPHGHNGHRFED